MKLAVLTVVLAAGAIAWPGGGGPEVVALGRDGERVAALDLPGSGAFALAYRHSVYRRPALERFRSSEGGSFRLVAVSSPSQAVLDYYELEGRRTRRGRWWTLTLARPVRFERLALAATAVGRRTLVAGDRRAPLFRRDGHAAHLSIEVKG